MQIQAGGSQSKTDASSKPKIVLAPAIINETSTVLKNESIPLSSAAVTEMLEPSKAPVTSSLESEGVSKPPVSQGTASKEAEEKPAVISIPYEGKTNTVPFKQEKEEGTLPILRPNNIDMQSFGEKVLEDIAAQNGEKPASKENSADYSAAMQVKNNAKNSSNASNVTSSPQPSINQSAYENDDIYVTTSFDIFMTWNPRMTDPAFPPRLNVIKLLNEAVSNSNLLDF